MKYPNIIAMVIIPVAAAKETGSAVLQCLTVYVYVFCRYGSDSQEAGDCRRWSVW